MGNNTEETNFSALRSAGIEPVLFDGTHLSPELESVLSDTTHLIISIAPPRQENNQQPDAMVDPVLIALANHPLCTLCPKLEWVVIFLQSEFTAIMMVNGLMKIRPSSRLPNGPRQRVRAEAEWLMVGEAENVPVGIFRLSGIYGPGRNALATAENGKSRRMIKPGQVFNRIHVTDIAEALYCAAKLEASGIYNITDDRPAPPQDVVTFAHSLLGTEPPQETDFESADISPMARSFYGENKRVSNSKSKAELGLKYTYPDYEAALSKMHSEGKW